MGAPSGRGEPLVTIVVSPREKYRLARQTVEHLLQETDPDIPIIYVDEERSPRRLRRWVVARAERVERLHHRSIEGRAGANECRAEGIAAATTPFVLLIDNDARLGPGALDVLLGAAERTGAAFVAPVYLYVDGRVHHAGGRASVVRQGGTSRLLEDHPFHGQPYAEVRARIAAGPADAPELHGVLVRRAALRAAGGLDPGLTAAMDCLDLGFRLRELGGGWLEPAATVTYDGAGPRPADLPLYLDRWARATVDADIERFARTWALDPADPRLDEHRQFLAARRRLPLRWLRGPVRRAFGPRVVAAVDRVADDLLDRATAGSRRRR